MAGTGKGRVAVHSLPRWALSFPWIHKPFDIKHWIARKYLWQGNLNYITWHPIGNISKEWRVAYESLREWSDYCLTAKKRSSPLKGRSSTIALISLRNPKDCNHKVVSTTEVAMKLTQHHTGWCLEGWSWDQFSFIQDGLELEPTFLQ